MRLFAFLFIVLCSTPALAQVEQSSEPTRLEVDQDANVIRVIVDGKAVAQFTSSGLMVVGDVEYGGTLRDRGNDAISAAIEGSAVSKDEGDAP